MYLHIDEKKLVLTEKGKKILLKYEKIKDQLSVNWHSPYSSCYYNIYLLKEDCENIRNFNLTDGFMEYIKSNPEILQYLYIKIIKEEKKRLLFECKKISIIRK